LSFGRSFFVFTVREGAIPFQRSWMASALAKLDGSINVLTDRQIWRATAFIALQHLIFAATRGPSQPYKPSGPTTQSEYAIMAEINRHLSDAKSDVSN